MKRLLLDLGDVSISKNNEARYWLGAHFAKLVYNPTADYWQMAESAFGEMWREWITTIFI